MTIPRNLSKLAEGADTSGVLNVTNGGTSNTAFTAKSGNVAGLVFYDGTKLTNDSTVTDVGYDTSSHTLTAKNFTFSGTSVATGGSYQEMKVAIAASAIDMSLGNYFTKTISGTTTFTVSNVPSTGTAISFILDLTNGGSATVNWWSGVKWANGSAPTLTSSGRDVLGFFTYDGGTTWNGFVLGKAMA